jgi:crotonobetainyl-CoA:carnitine CoA-transferase CaiB-like acyl-CoA transferase
VTLRAFEKEQSAWTEQAERPIVSTASGFSTCPIRGGTVLRQRCGPDQPPPLLGEHTAAVFGEWLGMSPVDVDQLRSDGVV